MFTRPGLAVVVALGLALLMAAPAAHGATPAPCRVRNVTQDDYGRSLIRMVERAVDGDRLRIHGACPGPIVIRRDIVIRGVGAGATLTGRWDGTVVEVKRGSTSTVRGLKIWHGDAGWGDWYIGAILNRGRLTLIDADVTDNGYEGAISNQGYLLVIDSVVRHEGCEGCGGGAISNSGWLIIRASTLVNNGAGEGGAIANWPSAKARLVDSVLTGNSSGYRGGAIANHGRLTLIRSTLSGNMSWYQGGGAVWSQGTSQAPATVRLIDTTITANEAGDLGGGILNGRYSTVSLEGSSSVTGNVPDDCIATPAC
jgi:hypothetical protein